MRARLTLASPGAVSPAFDESRPAGWHSPIPYLFGGLAAMLGLIAFALLILACSYWKLSGHLNTDENHPESGETSGDGEKQKKAEEGASGWENKVLVIMAGQLMPTFLATPSTSRSTSFGTETATASTDNFGSDDDDDKGDDGVVVIELGSDLVQRGNTEDGVDVHHHHLQEEVHRSNGGDAGGLP